MDSDLGDGGLHEDSVLIHEVRKQFPPEELARLVAPVDRDYLPRPDRAHEVLKLLTTVLKHREQFVTKHTGAELRYVPSEGVVSPSSSSEWWNLLLNRAVEEVLASKRSERRALLVR